VFPGVAVAHPAPGADEAINDDDEAINDNDEAINNHVPDAPDGAAKYNGNDYGDGPNNRADTADYGDGNYYRDANGGSDYADIARLCRLFRKFRDVILGYQHIDTLVAALSEPEERVGKEQRPTDETATTSGTEHDKTESGEC
jgi:hypothetical protein